ncbi:hypothetical protein BTS2_3197 [Bacillus sp. TS-2]|nr:hypothetical protein BTS2_3197 [Bacillus sp. TS-2]
MNTKKDHIQSNIYTNLYEHVIIIVYKSELEHLTITDLSFLTGQSEELILECLEFGNFDVNKLVFQ